MDGTQANHGIVAGCFKAFASSLGLAFRMCATWLFQQGSVDLPAVSSFGASLPPVGGLVVVVLTALPVIVAHLQMGTGAYARQA